MYFKNLVMQDTEKRFIDMANSTTAVPFTDTIAISDYNNYNGKRIGYYKRLDAEKVEFNNAIVQVRKRRDARIKAENELSDTIKRDRKKFRFCNNVLVWSIIAIIAILYFALRNGVSAWIKDVLIPEMGFEHFFAIFDGVFGANYRSSSSGIEVAVLAAILGVILYLSLLIFAIVQKKRYSRCGWLIGVLLGGLILEGGPVILCYMAVRLLFVPISYLIYFLVTPFGLIALGGTALLLLLIRNGKFELKRFKALGVLYMAVIIAVSAGGYYFGNPLSINSNNYYEAHNGKSTEQAVEIEVGKSYLANINEKGGEYYFVFTPTQSGSYTVSSDYNMRTKVKLYSENNGLLGSDEDKNTKGFSLTQNLQANHRYYICVGFIEDYHSGHFTVLLNKA